MIKEFENWRQEAAEVESSSSARLARPWLERVLWETGSSSMVDIGAQ